MVLIDWVSKKQPTIETSVFVAEFFAMKHGTEKLWGLIYKIRMMGIPLSGPSYVYGDNKSAITNSTRPESTLKKKSNSICYHAIRESVVMGESLLTHVGTCDNLADLLTKQTFDSKRRRLVGGLLYDIFDDHKVRLAGKVAGISATRRRRAQMSPILVKKCMLGRHELVPDTGNLRQ